VGVWWQDEDGRRLKKPIYTLPTGWAEINWATAVRDGDVISVTLVPLEAIAKPRPDVYSQSVLKLRETDGPKPAPGSGVRLLSTVPMLDLILRISGLKGYPLVKMPFSGGLFATEKMQKRLDAGVLVTRKAVYKSAIESGDPINYARVLQDMTERVRLRQETGREEQQFESRMLVDTMAETMLVLGVGTDEAWRVLIRRIGYDPFTFVRRRIRKEKPQ
jgi:hypothetical protein